MLELHIPNFFYLGILFLNVFLLLLAFIKSFTDIRSLQVESLNHLHLSWIGLAFFWFGFFILEGASPLYEVEPLLLLNYVVFFITPFMIEIFNFYLTLFSNRLSTFETYFPTLIGLSWGISIGAIISKNDVLLAIPLVLVSIISLFFMVYSMVIYVRIKNVEETLGHKNVQEREFLSSIKFIVIFTIIGGGYDAIWIPISFLFSDLFYMTSFLLFIVLAFLTILFLNQVRKMTVNLSKFDISIILNELN